MWLTIGWIGIFLRLLNLLGAPPENYYNLGNRYYRLGQFALAEQAYGRAAVSAKLKHAAYFNAGDAAYQCGEYSRAVDYYGKVVDLDPADEDAWHNLELAQSRLADQPDDAGADAARKNNRSNPAGRGLQSLGKRSSDSNGNANPNAAERLLSAAQASERRLQTYFSPHPKKAFHSGQQQDVFTLPPEQLADFIREDAQAGYPFKPNPSLLKPPAQSDEVDW